MNEENSSGSSAAYRGSAGCHYPFEVSFQELESNIDRYVAVTIQSLRSYYLVMPRGENFVPYAKFECAYEVLVKRTDEFTSFNIETVRGAVEEDPFVLIVLRCMLGFSPSELAYLARVRSGLSIPQGFARDLEKRARKGRRLFGTRTEAGKARIEAILQVVCETVSSSSSPTSDKTIHRLAKIDTERGLSTVQSLVKQGVPYSMLLYERFLGRPFASHRDAVSEQVGHVIEAEVEEQLRRHGVPFHKTGRAERVAGFDQAPDFLIPTADKPLVVIEAKLTEDDGTARDKVTRVQHLRQISDQGMRFGVIACIDGRGFSIRREDMKKLLIATRGNTFTMATIGRMVDSTELTNMRRSE